MATAAERDYSHRTTVQKLAVRPDERLEVAGDIGSTLRKELREVLGRGFIKSGELDGAIALVESIDDAKSLLARYRPRLRDTASVRHVQAGRRLQASQYRGTRWRFVHRAQ